VLAVVQHEQDLASAEEVDDRLLERHLWALQYAERGAHHRSQRFVGGGGGQFAQPRAVGEVREQLGGHLHRQPGLAHPADPGEGHETVGGEVGRHRRQLAVAANERRCEEREVARQRVERPQRFELAGADLEHPDRPVEVAQAVLAQVDELDLSVHERCGRLRAQDLAAVGDRHDPRRPINGGAEVVVVAQLRLARVQPHPHPHGRFGRPRFVADCALGGERGRDGRRSRAERGGQPVAHGREHPSALGGDRGGQELVVAGHRGAHRPLVSLPQPRRPLDVREQESHRARGGRHSQILPCVNHSCSG